MENKSIEIKRNIINLFNKVSAVFDSSGPRFFEYFGQRLVQLAGVKGDEKVLDVASGKGTSIFLSSEKVGTNGEIVKRGIKNTKILVMDAEKLDFNSETFDHILCGFGVFFFPNYKIAFNEFMRVLKKSGRFSFTTFSRKKDEKFRWLDDLVEKYLSEFKDELDEYQENDNPEFDTEEGLYKILNEAGFKNIQVVNEENAFIYIDEQEWWDKLWTHGYIEILEMIPKDKLEDFKIKVFEKLRQIKEEEGITTTMSVLYAFGEK